MSQSTLDKLTDALNVAIGLAEKKLRDSGLRVFVRVDLEQDKFLCWRRYNGLWRLVIEDDLHETECLLLSATRAERVTAASRLEALLAAVPAAMSAEEQLVSDAIAHVSKFVEQLTGEE